MTPLAVLGRGAWRARGSPLIRSAPMEHSCEYAGMRGCFVVVLWLAAAVGCGSRTALPVDTDSQCQILSDAAVGSGGALCYPETAKPSGRCSAEAPSCPFCAYPNCPVISELITPRTYYDCTCVAGLWICAVVRRLGSGCAPTIACLQSDGGTGAACLVSSGESCAMAEDGGGPICLLTSGVLTDRPTTRCGAGSCASGCTCSDPAEPSCTCQ